MYVKDKVRPRTVHEGPEAEKRYSSTLSLTSVLDEGGWPNPHLGRFTRGAKRTSRGLLGPRVSLNSCGKSCPHRDSIPGPSSP